LDRTVEKSKARAELKRAVKEAKGQKARVKENAFPFTDKQVGELKEFAKDILNKDVLGLTAQGLSAQQIATNLQVGKGTVMARIAAADKILGGEGSFWGNSLFTQLQHFKRQQKKPNRTDSSLQGYRCLWPYL
jgi:hypothetical protein